MATEPPHLPDDVVTNATVIERNRVVLACPVRGTPRPAVTWYRGDTPLPAGNHRVTSDGSLVLERSSADDTARYRCVAENVAGSVNHTVDLLVYGTPHTNDRHSRLFTYLLFFAHIYLLI